MKANNRLHVCYKGKTVGTLALTPDRKCAFEYSDQWIEEGFSISPFTLPLKKQVFVPVKPYFDGLFGVFADSLPDAWGNILLNRILRKNNINPDDITALDRLAIVGNCGMGALTYEPEYRIPAEISGCALDELMEQCQKILNAEYAEKLNDLYTMGGTSGGARPKIMTQIEGEEWIVKFPSRFDGMAAGKMEYDYAKCAQQCGIPMTRTGLFPSEKCPGYFGTKRFDRIVTETGIEKVHMLTAAALLEMDFNQPNLDYHSLMKLTKILTCDNPHDVESMYRRMCFNVFAHNRDDHSKNFSFLYDDAAGLWRLSPAYDLTYSNTYYGEHTTTVDYNGRNPGKKEILAVGMAAGLDIRKCETIADEIKTCVKRMLVEYLEQ